MDAVNINKMQKPELRRFLQARGITVGDYRLEQLRELAEKAAQMELPVIKPDDFNISMEKRSTIRIDDVTVQHPVVYDQSLGNWTDDLNEIPIITAVDIFAHLMANACWDKKRVNQYKEERGYKLFRNRHISEKPYLVWCLLSSDGAIFSAGCECTGDDGGCKHVVALLFALVVWGERHTDRYTETCTDVKCVWDNPRRESKPRKMDEISMSEKERMCPFLSNYDPARDMNNNDIETEVYNLVKDYDTQIIEVLDTDCHLTPEPCTVPDLALLYKTSHNNLSFFDFVKSSLGNEECTEITNLTEGQSENMLWYRYRMGRVTASSAYSVVKYSGTDPNNYLVKEVLAENPNYVLNSPAIVYGRDREGLAREIFHMKFKQEHKDSSIVVPGLMVNCDFPHVGASPNGIVKCKCCGIGSVEIKWCPDKYRKDSVDEISAKNYHIYIDKSGNMKLKHTPPWYYQIQCQLAVSNMRHCYFVMYLEGSCGLSKHEIYVEKIVFDEDFWIGCLDKINSFYENFVVTKLLSE